MPSVEVVVPLRPGDHATIVHCLAALAGQTVVPRRVVLVDDGGPERDHALQLGREFARTSGLELTGIARRWCIGHVATLKRQARASDADVLVMLQPSTVLESPGYLQACLDALDGAHGVAAACGRAAALWPRQRARLEQSPAFRRWVGTDGYADPLAARSAFGRGAQWLAAAVLAHVLRLGLDMPDRVSMRACGGIALPAGGAVAYRRRYLQDLFDRVEPVRGDDLGAWPEHVIAHALATEGYRLVRLEGVLARVQPPPLHCLPRKAWACMVGWLQAGYWFDPLLRSPLRALSRRVRGRVPGPRRGRSGHGAEDASSEPFGERITRLQGRPLGRHLLVRAAAIIGLPVLAWVLLLLGQWVAVGCLALAEATTAVVLSRSVAGPGRRGAAALHAVLATPLRWGLVVFAPLAVLRVASGVWLDRRFRWRPGVSALRGRRSARGG